MRRVAAFVLCACAQITGIDGLSVDHGTREPASANDADIVEDAGGDDATRPQDDAGSDVVSPFDSGGDTTPPACTALPTSETFVAQPGAPWLLRGAAAFANPGVRLTPSSGGQTGGLFWDAPYTFDKLDVTFAYVITTDPASTAYGPGDGLAFSWIAAASAPDVVANNGGGLGVGGLTGWAVAIDAYQNPDFTDPPTPNISIKNTVDMSNIAASAANATLLDGKEHFVRVRLSNGAVSVSLDGTEVIGATALPGYTASSGYFGFSAATGGAFEDHVLTGVTARIGTSGPCAAP